MLLGTLVAVTVTGSPQYIISNVVICPAAAALDDRSRVARERAEALEE
ncbi:MAG TPA: hypothetical protein VK923_02680 [Euzebyales bacterium]|nr:hypothetical protein [Euzebyales bacterium]